MTIQSMTGFARSDGQLGDARWHWEVRSVNNRGLDLRCRFPTGYDALDPKVREAVGKRFTRGSINITLALAREAEAAELRVNEAALAQVVRAARQVADQLKCEPPRADVLLGLRGVIEVAEVEEAADVVAERTHAMLLGFDQALDGLSAARASEGARLKVALMAQVDEIERLSQLVDASPTRTPAAIQTRLREQVARLMETGQALDPARLHQEAILIATRVDVDEELKRLFAHIAAARGLLGETTSIGRKLDFLAQEFNREANTLTSKAADQEIARAGLALKVVIDQLREQVQNIE